MRTRQAGVRAGEKAPKRSRGMLLSLSLACALVLLTAVGVSAPTPSAQAEGPFSFNTVIAKAQSLSKQPYVQPKGMVPDFLLGEIYDQWRDIRFKTDKSLWRKPKNSFFEVQFFHPGLYYDRTVAMNVVENGKAKHYAVTKEMYDYGKNTFYDQVPMEIGTAGFRFHAPYKNKNYPDEFLVFLGASYLRGVARDHHYGLSARGLAVDTASPKGEEFPWFREFWLFTPKAGDKDLTLYALLDSPSVTGAYAYTARPGQELVIDVQSVVFMRKNVEKIGIGPMTSMFFYGENTYPKPEDYRPEVHDSDGLLLRMVTGEWVWRPLQNPKGLQVNSFQAPNVRGFGLLQRDRDFNNYHDLEARYENRPSIWIEPKGDWGDGRVELVQIPTDTEINDNIVAYWIPDKQAEPGEPMRFDYTMRWYSPTLDDGPTGQCVATRITPGRTELEKIFVMDFDGKAIRALKPDAKVEGVISVGAGARLIEQQAYRNDVTGAWRLHFKIALDGESTLGKVLPDKRPPIEMRVFLRSGFDVLTETWSYAYKPQ
ncbi:MAG: glucan biosynthesis protein [Thermodesulfobacteriota bacterium]